MKKILTVVGARPQFVKAAAVSRVFNQMGITEILVHTGQHFDANMSDVFFEEMNIPKPKYNLEINGLNHGAMTGRMLEKIEEVLLIEKPEMLMVYGDTNSTLAGALAAKKLHIPVAHVEAGLRSFNMAMPEEINRILTDRISDILFCPTQAAINNLYNEGFKNINAQIIKAGDVMQDAAIYYSTVSQSLSKIINKLNLTKGEFIVCTIHRQENTDNIKNLQQLIEGLNEINKSKRVIFPMHPRTRNIIAQNGLITNFIPIEPVGYFDMIELLKNCALVITDSGGLQKEAFFFQKNCVTVRDQTEWIELVEQGFNALAGTNKNLMLSLASEMMQRENNFSVNLYGQGKASEVIASSILKL